MILRNNDLIVEKQNKKEQYLLFIHTTLVIITSDQMDTCLDK